jgi:hypothetical protein
MSVITYEGEYNGKQVRAEIDVRQANVRAGMVRTRLQSEGKLSINASDTDIDLQMLRVFVYPDYIAGSPVGWIEIDGERVPWPVPFETFITLPFDLCARWEQEVYRENPFWLPEAVETQKKV